MDKKKKGKKGLDLLFHDRLEPVFGEKREDMKNIYIIYLYGRRRTTGVE